MRTHIPPSSWPQRRSSLRRWWERCSRIRWSSGSSWWNTGTWCRACVSQGRLPTGQSRWRCSGTESRWWRLTGRASCPSWRCYWACQWPRNLQCCTRYRRASGPPSRTHTPAGPARPRRIPDSGPAFAQHGPNAAGAPPSESWTNCWCPGRQDEGRTDRYPRLVYFRSLHSDAFVILSKS